jgi:hypothetical protein
MIKALLFVLLWLGGGFWAQAQEVPLRPVLRLQLPQRVYQMKPMSPPAALRYYTRPDSAHPHQVRAMFYPDWALQRDSCILFLNCGHRLTAPAPLRSKKPQFRFVAAGALVTISPDNMMHIAPFADRATIWAYRRRRLVFKHTFSVWLIPPPTLQCRLSEPTQSLLDKPLAERLLMVQVRPDATFATFLPDDARYRLGRALVTVIRAGQVVGVPLQVAQAPLEATQPIRLRELAALARPGDEMQIEVQTVQRMNYCAEIEELPFAQQLTILLL